MSVETSTNKITLNGDGVQTDFPFNFALLQASDLDVYVDGALQSAGNYTVVPTAGNIPPFPTVGGTVSFGTAPDNITHTPVILIVRLVDVTQTFSPPVDGDIPNSALEKAYDKLTMIDQQLTEVVSRALTIPIVSPAGISTTIPGLIPLDVLRANSTGTGLEFVTPQQANLDTAANGPLPAPIAGDLLIWDPTGTFLTNINPATFPPGAGDVVGPAGAGDRRIALYNGATGKLLKNGPALGTAGQVLTSQGAGADPIMADLPGALGGSFKLGKNKIMNQPGVSSELLTILLNDGRMIQGGASTNCAKGSTDGTSQLGPVVWDPINPPANGVTVLDFAYSHCSLFVVLSDNTVYSGGINTYGQLGHGSVTTTPYLKKIAFFAGKPIKSVFCTPGSNDIGNTSVFFVGTDEKVYGCGYNLQGQLGDNTLSNKLTPVLVFDTATVDGAGKTVVDIQTGHSTTGFTAIVTSKATNNLHVCGKGTYGVLGQGDVADHKVFVVCPVTSQVTKIRLLQSNGAANLMAITDLGACHVWGSNAHHQGANGGVALKEASGVALAGLTANVVDGGIIGSGTLLSCFAQLANGDLYTWGNNSNNCLFAANTAEITVPTKKYNQKTTKVYGWNSSYVALPVGGSLYVVDDSTPPLVRFTGINIINAIFPVVLDPGYASGTYRCSLPREIMDGTDTISDLVLISAGATANNKGFLLTSKNILYGNGYGTDAQITDYNASTVGAVSKEPTKVYHHRMNEYFK